MTPIAIRSEKSLLIKEPSKRRLRVPPEAVEGVRSGKRFRLKKSADGLLKKPVTVTPWRNWLPDLTPWMTPWSGWPGFKRPVAE